MIRNKITIALLEAILRGIMLLVLKLCDDKELADEFFKYAESTIRLLKDKNNA